MFSGVSSTLDSAEGTRCDAVCDVTPRQEVANSVFPHVRSTRLASPLYCVALKDDGTFWMLASHQRFEALCCAVESDHPARAASMREWSPAAQWGILGWLESITKQTSTVHEVEL